MNCSTFHKVKTCPEVWQEEHWQHLQSCDECLSSWSASLADPQLQFSTLGLLHLQVCEAAQNALASGESTPFLVEHVNGCGPCSKMKEVLAVMEHDLPSFQEADPGPDFVASTLIKIFPLSPQQRLFAWLKSLTLRPRFAVEAAFALSLLLFWPFLKLGERVQPIKAWQVVLAEELQETNTLVFTQLSGVGGQSYQILQKPLFLSGTTTSNWWQRIHKQNPIEGVSDDREQ